MKKLFKWLLVAFLVFIVLLALALLVLKFMFPMEKIKAQVQEQVKNNLNREIDFKDFSLSFSGLEIRDFALSEKTTFKEGTFISAKKAEAEIDLKALLHKQIKIEKIGFENLTVNIVKDKDGIFNFADLIPQEETPQATAPSQTQQGAALIALSAKQIYTKDASINFEDKANEMKFGINNLNIQINNFDFAKDFSVFISCLSKINTPALTLDPVLFKTETEVNLANLDLPKAKAEIKDFSITYDKAALNLSGLIADFSNPQINLTGTLNGIDNKLFKNFIQGEITPFSMPIVNMLLSAKMNIEKGTLDISQAKASIGNSFIKTKAALDYSKADISFSSKTNIELSLDEIASIAKETLQAFDLKGNITGNINASQDKTLNVKGDIAFKNVGAQILNQKLEKTNGVLKINSLEDISANKWTGTFGASPWNLTLAYKKAKNTNIDLTFYMQKFTLEDINFETLLTGDKSSAQEQEPLVEKDQKEQTSVSSEKYNLKADITIDKIENNVLTANAFKLKTDIKDFDLSLAKTQGSLSFSTREGQIRDIDKLMASSKLLSVIFTSVQVVQKAFNFAKLDNSSITNGIINCSLIDAEYTLKEGVVGIVKTNIDSDLTVVKATGSADLLKDSIDMKIQAQLGKTGSKGYKPLVINVKGALSNPSYKLDVLSSLTSIIGDAGKGEQSQGNMGKDIASSAGDMVKTIGSLFKKK